MTDGETWRQRAKANFYDVWDEEQRVEFKKYQKKMLSFPNVEEENRACDDNNYRISPLVSDVLTWQRRMNLDLRLFKRRELPERLTNAVRDMGFALMNANIRANLNSRAVLQGLLDIARDAKLPEQAACHAYEKANQHQGEWN